MIQRPETGSLIGIHGNKVTNVLFEHIRQAAAQGTPFTAVKLTQEQTALADVKRDSPETLTVARVPHEHDGMEGIADEGRMTEARALEWAAVIMGHAFDYLGKNPDLVQHIDVYELVNEPDPNTLDGWYNMGAIMRQCVLLGRERYPSIVWGIGSWNAGTPERTEMEAFIESGILDEGKHGDVVLCTHEGIFHDDDGIRHGHGDLIPGADTVPEHGGSLIGRVAYFEEIAGDKMIPVIISEAYYQGYHDATLAKNRMKWADMNVYSNLWYVVAVLPFTHSPTAQWDHQDYTGTYDLLIPYMHNVRDMQNATKPEPPPPPPEQTPAEVFWASNVLTLNYPVNGALKLAAERDGYWPVTNEHDRDVGGVTYRGQKARHPTTGALRWYYARVGDWGNVQHADEPGTEPEPETFEPAPPITQIPLRITQGGYWRAPRTYGEVSYEHEGVDFGAVLNGTAVNVFAIEDGIVEEVARRSTGYGHHVWIRHNVGGETYRSLYAHLSVISSTITVGVAVGKGHILGVAGTTGNSTGIHLHFSLQHIGHRAPGNFISGDWIDPTPYYFGAPPPPSTQYLIGVDVSHWQGAMDWHETRNAGARYAFVKVSEGTTFTDPNGAANIAGALLSGIPVGPYHYYRNWVDPIAQADHFVSRIPEGCNLPPVVDFEDPSGAPDDIADRLHRFIERVAARTGIMRQIIYTRANYWRDTVGNPAWASTHYLWVAHYTTATQPSTPETWANWHFWQYTSDGDGTRYGASGARIDLNRFNGTQADLGTMHVTYDMRSPTIDMLSYLRGDGRGYMVRHPNGSEEKFRTVPGDLRWKQLKNQQWEQFYRGDGYIWRSTDTSAGDGNYYIQWEDGHEGARWCKRAMTAGETFTAPAQHTVQTYRKSDCAPVAHERNGKAMNRVTLVAHHPSKTWNGITVKDVIELLTNTGETMYFGYHWGLVAWTSPWGSSSIVKVLPEHEWDNEPEQGCYS